MSAFTLVIGDKNWSSWSMRPWLVMRHFAIPFNEVPVGLRRDDTRENILQYSPSGQVPILIDTEDDLKIWDSLAICEYLAETYPDRGLWPNDPAARAHARSVSAEMHGGFMPMRREMPMECNARYEARNWPDDVQSNIDRIKAIWQDCRRLNPHRAQEDRAADFLFGRFTIADAMFAPVVSRFVTYGVSLDGMPEVEAYVRAMWNLAAFGDWRAGTG